MLQINPRIYGTTSTGSTGSLRAQIFGYVALRSTGRSNRYVNYVTCLQYLAIWKYLDFT
jgi:hypothetical protein